MKIPIPLKNLSNFWGSLEISLINCKIHSNIADTTLKITSTKLYVPIVTSSSKGNVKLVKLLQEGFKRSVYWNECRTKIETRDLHNSNLTRFPLNASFQVVRRLFLLPFENTDNGAKKVERNSHTNIFFQE